MGMNRSDTTIQPTVPVILKKTMNHALVEFEPWNYEFRELQPPDGWWTAKVQELFFLVPMSSLKHRERGCCDRGTTEFLQISYACWQCWGPILSYGLQVSLLLDVQSTPDVDCRQRFDKTWMCKSCIGLPYGFASPFLRFFRHAVIPCTTLYF